QLRFETLIGNLLAEFSALAPEKVDEHIDASLALIVGTLAIDRAGIAQITDDGECLVFTHAVLSDDAASAPTTPTMRVPSAVARLRDGHAVTVSHLDHLPPDAATDRQGLLAAGVRSIALVPLATGQGTGGVLSLSTVRSERAWPPRLLERLQLVGEILADAMAQNRASRALRESEERFRLLAEAAPVMIWMSGPDARCTYFNRPWLDFTGRRMEQELGDGWTAGVHPEDVGGCVDGYLRAFHSRATFTREYRLRSATGEYRWVLDHGVPRIERDGRFVGYIGSCIDTTDLKETRQALLDSIVLRSAVFASLPGRL